MVAVAVALNPDAGLFLHPSTTQEKIVAVAEALNPGGTLFLPANTTQEKMVAVAEALNPGAILCLAPWTAQEKMVAVAVALNPGGAAAQAKREAVSRALETRKAAHVLSSLFRESPKRPYDNVDTDQNGASASASSTGKKSRQC